MELLTHAGPGMGHGRCDDLEACDLPDCQFR